MLPEKEDFVKFDNLNKKCDDEKGINYPFTLHLI